MDQVRPRHLPRRHLEPDRGARGPPRHGLSSNKYGPNHLGLWCIAPPRAPNSPDHLGMRCALQFVSCALFMATFIIKMKLAGEGEALFLELPKAIAGAVSAQHRAQHSTQHTAHSTQHSTQHSHRWGGASQMLHSCCAVASAVGQCTAQSTQRTAQHTAHSAHRTPHTAHVVHPSPLHARCASSAAPATRAE